MTILKISYIDIIITYIIFNSLINDNLISKSPNFHKKCVFSKNLISKVFFFFPYLFKLNLLSICIYNKLFYHFNQECFFIIIIIRFNFFCSLLVFNILLLFVYYYYFRQTIHKSCNQPHFFFLLLYTQHHPSTTNRFPKHHLYFFSFIIINIIFFSSQSQHPDISLLFFPIPFSRYTLRPFFFSSFLFFTPHTPPRPLFLLL